MTVPAQLPDRGRLLSVDVLRGIVMIFMALDHGRDYFTNLRVRPEDLSQASVTLFATRWVTHFCAPLFFLLAGVGIGIAMNRGKTAGEMSRFLITRGLWLVVLELTITAVFWQFSLVLVPMFAIVIWALGWSMVLMGVLVHLPRMAMTIVSLALIIGHNLFDAVRPESFGGLSWLWHVLHVPGFAVPGTLLVAYPLIPWVGVMALGFVIATSYQWEPARRQRLLIIAGIAATVAFVALRALNAYGEPRPWSDQRTTALTIASFFNTTKYPPSLHFLLMTLGPGLVALGLLERTRARWTEFVAVYGRVPLFYYVTHIFLLHVMAVVLGFVQHGRIQRVNVITGDIPPDHGVGLAGVYALWILAVLLMYLPCRWYGDLKARGGKWWLSYT